VTKQAGEKHPRLKVGLVSPEMLERVQNILEHQTRCLVDLLASCDQLC
jgi:hypothetical protein